MDLPILILAGGASSRMGNCDKLLEQVDGVPLLRLQAERALEVSNDVSVLLRPGNHAARACIADLPVTILQPQEALDGMGGSLSAGTMTLRNAPGFLLLLADLVEVQPKDMCAILSARIEMPNHKIWRGATEGGEPGHPILFDAAVFADLITLSGDAGGRTVIQKHAHHVHLVPLPGQRARRDLDSPEDWENWRAERDT